MAMLTPKQFGTFRDFLVECFPGRGLVELTRIALDEVLGNIVGLEKQAGRDIASDLVVWVEARGLTPKLVAEVRLERPARADLQAFCAELASTPAGPPPSLDPNAVHDRVIAFRTAFAQRREWFDRLNAYKRLHEVLHKLLAIDEAVKQFQDGPAGPLGLERIANALEDDLLDEAADANKGTEFPEEADKWIGSFREAVDGLRAARAPADLAALRRAVEALRALPPQQQAGLDRELVRCALRLKAEELAAMLDEILAGPSPPAGPDALRSELSKFRELCRPLGGLTADHSLCQDIETALAAVPPEDATRDRVPRWPDVLAGLLRVAGRRPGDKTAGRMAGYSRTFDAADGISASGQFTLLRDEFARLFGKTDKDLLAVTDGLVREAALLNALLGGFI